MCLPEWKIQGHGFGWLDKRYIKDMKARSSDSGSKNSDSFFQDLAATAFKSLKSGFVKAVLGTIERRALSLLGEFLLLFLLL
jgi:hypothetical protein